MKKKWIKNQEIINIIVISIMLLTKFLSFVRDLKVTAIQGASIESDAYNIAYLLAITIFGFIGSAFSNSIMPIASELYIKDKRMMHKTINNVLCISTLFVSIMVALCYIKPNIFVNLMASGVSKETYRLAEELVKITIFSLVFLLYNSVFSIALRIYDANIVPTIGEFLFPVTMVIALFGGVKSVYSLVNFLVIGYLIQCIFQLIYLIRLGYRPRIYFNFKDPYFINVVKIMPPMLISTGFLQISSIIDNRMASQFGMGSITALSLAIKVNGLAYTLFSTSLMQIVYSRLSKANATGDIKEFQSVVKKQTSTILFFIIPVSICLFLFSSQIMTLLFVRGNYTQKNAIIASNILIGFVSGLIIFVLRDICNYILYSAKNSVFPSIIGGFSVVINIILNQTLPRIIGIQGISFATSISALVAFILLLIFIKRKMNNIHLMNFPEIILYILSGSIMFGIMKFAKEVIFHDLSIIVLFGIMITGVILFWIIVLTGRRYLKGNHFSWLHYDDQITSK
jgi:putative peptidoglycan lipid II flippase